MFYSSDKTINQWIGKWIQTGPENRNTLANELRIIRRKYGTEIAKKYRNHIMWIGSYCTK
jgi:hypothetical protein